ncbi:CDP-glucose 4,6-dehydratase [Propionicicella superfundia]|uniref:CDP-glucose 4,6-dehydratase n=1 Tax=Propionicicella superfundia TaxID=348582 RepID=UPI00048B4472|nr:CDP-glucose 4,6-dehydratase [Propionicicella superfundia]
MQAEYWRDCPVFITGHTGFKGAWLCLLLERMGARIHGYALETPADFLYHRAGVSGVLASDVRGDIRDTSALTAAIDASGAEVVLHLAAQSVVRESYANPRETFSTNVDGTLSVLQAARAVERVTRCVVVTTDKVYRNNEWFWGYRETDHLGGDDPYSASKAATELVTHSMAVSYPRDGYAVATARAGNVIGGGDATPDALIPELISAFAAGRPAVLRYPQAVRPWQHVLEPLSGYLTLAEKLDPARHDTAWNFGPPAEDALTVGEVADRLGALWGDGRWERAGETGPHEAGLLTLDSAKAHAELGWRPTLAVQEALSFVADWESSVRDGRETPRHATERQVAEYLARAARG